MDKEKIFKYCKIIEVLKSDDEHLTCDDIAYRLNKNKMHIGTSIKYLVINGIIDTYKDDIESNPKYFYNL